MDKYRSEIERRLNADPVIRKLFMDFEQSNREDAAKKAKEDPERYKLSPIIANGKPASWRYYQGGEDTDGNRVIFGYCCWRNIAGYFLSFRQKDLKEDRDDGTCMVRDRWVAHKTRKAAEAFSKRCADDYDGR